MLYYQAGRLKDFEMDISIKHSNHSHINCPSCDSKTLQEFQLCGQCGYDLERKKFNSFASRVRHNFLFYAATASSFIAGFVLLAGHIAR